MRITVESRIDPSPRVQQVRGMFDLPDASFSRESWDVELPLDAAPWSIGLITGPSGSGKSTVARKLFSDCMWSDSLPAWPAKKSILDGFPAEQSVKDITALLSSVGFSSPPAWVRPYHVLSTGQKFRCDLARLIAFLPTADRTPPTAIGIFDEFTSVVDRTVAKVGSAALAKTVRQRGLQFVAVSCHDDIIDWLQPDWIFTPADGHFARRSLRQRPTLDLDIMRSTLSAWPLFAPHHYLSHTCNHSAACFLALHAGRPVAFSAWINQLSLHGGKREHRTVVLPDYQGIGIGMAVSDTIASVWSALGHRATSTTTHPAFIAARRRSKHWTMTRSPSLAGGSSKLRHATTRLTAGFVYTGPPMDFAVASQLLADSLRK